MHFHLPKPLHGWRAFAGEVGIIVVGVLIALAAEQVVETLHWRSEIADAEQALNREAAFNLGAILKRQEEGPCIDRRLQEIRERLSAGNYGTIEGARQSIGQPQLWRPRTNVCRRPWLDRWRSTCRSLLESRMRSSMTASSGFHRRRPTRPTRGACWVNSTTPENCFQRILLL